MELVWQISISDLISIVADVVAILVAIYLGYWLSERSQGRQQLRKEYESLGHPFGAILREVYEKASEIKDNYEKLRNSLTEGIAGLQLERGINSCNALNHLLDFYKQKQEEQKAFPKTIPLPLTPDEYLNRRLWQATECASICQGAASLHIPDQEKLMVESLSKLIDSIVLAAKSLEDRYGRLQKETKT